MMEMWPTTGSLASQIVAIQKAAHFTYSQGISSPQARRDVAVAHIATFDIFIMKNMHAMEISMVVVEDQPTVHDAGTGGISK
nr:hypothetical protein [Tanacetum cinerariifolium]